MRGPFQPSPKDDFSLAFCERQRNKHSMPLSPEIMHRAPPDQNGHPTTKPRALSRGERAKAAQRRRRAAAIAAYIGQCDDVLHAELIRCGGRWPEQIVLPYRHQNSVERAVLPHWLDELRAKSHKPIRIFFQGQPTD